MFVNSGFASCSVSMNAAGDRVAIGADENDGNGADAGHVRLYEWSTGASVLNILANNSIYPNPFTTSTTIELPLEPHILTIYDIVGNKVREEQVLGTTVIERGGLTKGIYIIKAKSETQTLKGKVLVE